MPTVPANAIDARASSSTMIVKSTLFDSTALPPYSSGYMIPK